MRYKQKIVTPPEGLEVGSKVGVCGDGDETYEVIGLYYYEDGTLESVHLDSGWREPLSKIYLLRGRDHYDAMQDPTSWFDVAVGECDVCGHKFPDSCSYHSTRENPSVMICRDCYAKGHRA